MFLQSPGPGTIGIHKETNVLYKETYQTHDKVQMNYRQQGIETSVQGLGQGWRRSAQPYPVMLDCKK